MLERQTWLRPEGVSQRCCGSVQVTQAGCFSSFLHEGPKLELLPGQETHVLQPDKQSQEDRSRLFLLASPPRGCSLTLRKTSRSITPLRRASPR